MKFTAIDDDGRPFTAEANENTYETLTAHRRTLPNGWEHIVKLDSEGRVPPASRGSSKVSVRQHR